MTNQKLEQLQSLIGYTFQDIGLLVEALTHPSLRQHLAVKYINKNHSEDCIYYVLTKKIIKDYERLEILGDSILSFIITEALFKKFTSFTEGDIAKARSFLICSTTVCDVANTLELAKAIIMTEGEISSGGRQNPKNIENAMEALIGAIYLDSNIAKVQEIIMTLWYDKIHNLNMNYQEAKTALQEFTQSLAYGKPTYELISKIGLAHAPTFTIKAIIKDYSAQGTGKTIKTAEQEAATKLLTLLKNAINYE